MITNPRNNYYESSEGYSVEVLGRTGLRYSEGKHSLFIDSEVVFGPSGMMVYRDSVVRWDAPFDAEIIEITDRERILKNVRKVFSSQGFDIDVI